MICNDARPLLDLLSDGALEPKDTALVLDHLKACDACQSEWNDLEQIRATFQAVKTEPPLPPDLMNKISRKLKEQERSESRFFKPLPRAVSFLSIAAVISFICFITAPQLHRSRSGLPSNIIQTESADTLVDDLNKDESVQPVADGSDLAKKLTYEPRYLHLVDWHMKGLGIYRAPVTVPAAAPAAVPIARFDFERKNKPGQYLTCYQAPQGVIHARVAESETINGKNVQFGSRGKFQFALWSQNGRDYLFVTSLAKQQLEEIVRGT